VKELRYNGGQMIPRRLREGLPVDGHQCAARRTAAIRIKRRHRDGGCVSRALEKRVVGLGRIELRRHVPRKGGIAALLA